MVDVTNPRLEDFAAAAGITPLTHPPARLARCADCGRTEPSSPKLPFFEDRSPGSKWAAEHCAKCACYPVAHEPSERWTPTGYPTVIGEPHAFEPHPGHEFDGYYCGCRGWD